MKEEHNLALIDKILSGQASAEEKLAFDQLMENDQEFSALVKDVELIQEGIQYAATKDELKNFVQTLDKKNPIVFWRIAAAISLLTVCAFSIYWFNRPADYYQEYYGRYTALTFQAPRGIADLYELKTSLLNDYKKGNGDQESLIQVQNLLEAYPNDQDLLLLCGLLLMETGSVEAAMDYLVKIDARDLSSISSYYLSLAYLKLGDYEKARIELKGVVEPDSLIDVAEQLLMKLDE
jgi:tetratricopeptide (TPR) repeat protein